MRLLSRHGESEAPWIQASLLPPLLESLVRPKAGDVAPAVLGDERAVLLDHHQGGDAGDAELGLEPVGHARVVLGGEPLAVGVLHVGQHVGLGPAGG